MITLDDVRNLDPDEVTDTDVAVLKEHKDELTEDEKLRYSSFIEEAPPKTPEPPVEPPKVEEPPAEPPKTPEPPTPPADNKIVMTKEEIAALVSEAVGKVAPKSEPKKEEPPKEFVPQDWTPTGWGEVLDKAVEYVEYKRFEAQKKAQAELDAINAGLTKEIDELRDAGEPIPAKGTEEYKKFDRELSNVAVKYRIPSFKLAYEVYKQLPKESKSDAPPAPVAPPAAPQKPANADNKEVAKIVGGPSIEVGKKTTVDYKNIRGKTPTQVVSEFLDELE